MKPDPSVSITWQTLAAMVSISGAVVTVAMFYVRTFVKSELLQIKLEMLGQMNAQQLDVVSKMTAQLDRLKLSMDEVIELNIDRIDHRLDGIEKERRG